MLRHFVLTTSTSFASPDPGNCGCAAPALPRAPTDTAPLWGTAPTPGSATPVLARRLVGTKALGALHWGQGPGWAFSTAWLQEGSGYHSSLSCLVACGATLMILLPLFAGSTGKPELVSPSTSSQELSMLSQGVLLLKSSCFLRPRQALKRRYPEEEIPSRTTYSPPAKRRRIDDGPAHSADESSPSTSRQAVLRLPEGTLAVNSQAAQPRRPYRPPWLFHGSTTDNRSQPGPIRMRHIWRQQRRAKKPYCQP